MVITFFLLPKMWAAVVEHLGQFSAAPPVGQFSVSRNTVLSQQSIGDALGALAAVWFDSILRDERYERPIQ